VQQDVGHLSAPTSCHLFIPSFNTDYLPVLLPVQALGLT